jgi:fatty-acyl-CoA synthase
MERGVLVVRNVLTRSARWYGDRPALTEAGSTITYRELDDRCRRVAHRLQGAGLRKGDRLTFLAASSIDLVTAFHGAHRLGLVTANLHGREAIAQHEAILAALRPRLLVHDDALAPMAGALEARLPGLRRLALGALIDAATASGEAPAGDPDVDLDEDDPATVLLSSGTTGLPKALLHTQRDVLTSCHGLMSAWSGIQPEDVFLNAFSPSFAVWLGHMTAFLNHGAHVVLLGRWSAEAFVQAAARHRATCAALTASMWKGVLALDLARQGLPSLRLAYWLGERMARERIEDAFARVTPHLGCLYGLAEFIGGTGFTMIRAHELRAGKWTSIGKPMLNTDLRVVRAGGGPGDELPPGEVGEILLRGATLARESLTDPAWRATRVRSGWLATGDLASRDPDGYVHLEGRADYMINSGGIKFSPEDVEAVLEQHPAVAEAAVLGVPDEARGQRVLAVIVPGRDTLTAEVLDEWARGHEALAAFKRPRDYRFAASLPRTATGKLDRREVHRTFTA